MAVIAAELTFFFILIFVSGTETYSFKPSISTILIGRRLSRFKANLILKSSLNIDLLHQVVRLEAMLNTHLLTIFILNLIYTIFGILGLLFFMN